MTFILLPQGSNGETNTKRISHRAYFNAPTFNQKNMKSGIGRTFKKMPKVTQYTGDDDDQSETFALALFMQHILIDQSWYLCY